MAVQLKELLERVKEYDIKLLAGAKGLEKPVRWVHMVENAEISSFLEGEEIAFTTGIGLESQENLIDLVTANYENKASGMIVNIGPFIRQISPAVIVFCNEHDFPLFKVPWNVHMAGIMRTFCFAITESEKKDMELVAALKNAIFCPAQEDMYVNYMEQNGFLQNWNYCAAILECWDGVANISIPLRRLEQMRHQMENLLTHSGYQVESFLNEQRLVLVFARYTEEEVEAILKEIYDVLNHLLLGNEEMYIGAGKVTKSAKCIYKSYEQALKLEKLKKIQGHSGEVSLYGKAGLYKLLLSVEDPDMLKEYVGETVAPLIRYDRVNETDYTVFLRSYLKHGGSVKEAAEELFVHRNTVNYKLKKIEELLSVDLSDFATRQRMDIGFLVDDIYQSQ